MFLIIGWTVTRLQTSSSRSSWMLEATANRSIGSSHSLTTGKYYLGNKPWHDFGTRKGGPDRQLGNSGTIPRGKATIRLQESVGTKQPPTRNLRGRVCRRCTNGSMPRGRGSGLLLSLRLSAISSAEGSHPSLAIRA